MVFIIFQLVYATSLSHVIIIAWGREDQNQKEK